MPTEGVTLEVLAERLRALKEDVTELRATRKDDHHRLRSVEAVVAQMVDAQKAARAGEAKQYRQMGNRIALGGLTMAAAMVILSIVTLLYHA